MTELELAASVESANLVTLHHWDAQEGWNKETELTDQQQKAISVALRGHAQTPAVPVASFEFMGGRKEEYAVIRADDWRRFVAALSDTSTDREGK